MKVSLNREIELNDKYDVIVIGGGPAGVAAAVASAREGASTMLIEASSMLGGMATKGLVPAWTPYTDGVRIIYGGISKRVFLETKSFMSDVVPKDNYDWVQIDFERLKHIYDDIVREAGVHVLFDSFCCGVEMSDERNVERIIISNKSGLTAYKAKVYVDCTGDADVYAFAGGRYAFGDDDTHETQPGSYCFVLANVNQQEFEKLKSKIGSPLHGGNPNAITHKIVADGKFGIPDTHCCGSFIAKNVHGFNAGHVWELDYTDPESVSEKIFEGRDLANRYLDALKEYLPEIYGDAYLVMTAPTLGCRESRRIEGDYTFTVEDYLDRRSFADEIARNNYYIDIHKSRAEEGSMKEHADNRYEHYKDGESHGVPYRILCPKQFDNMLVAGRTVSSDRITQGSLRIMPCCLCEGEAAGMAAAFAAEKSKINIHTVDTQRLRRRLIEEGGYLPKLDTDTF